MDSASKEPSPAPSSAGSTIDDPELDRKALAVDSENDISLATLLDHEDTPDSKNKGLQYTAWTSQERRRGQFARKTKPRAKLRKRKTDSALLQDRGPDGTEDEGSVAPSEVRHTMGTAVGTRRQANGTIGSVYSGNKIRHIKKEDGTPLWRKDIQHEFLRAVIDDTTPVFTRISDKKTDCNFAEIYIDALTRSSKTSKVLKDRLHTDLPAAKNMAMICLLVNVGRMNTTLNFFPEMRAQLRTYHSIPSLQAHHSQRDYKSLQDAPRLKSILKGASEDNPDEPRTLEALHERAVPRTNPVNLIFVLSQFAPKISEIHFNSSVDFFDLVIKHTLSSKSRARAFLWLMWWYLESSFTRDDALHNPFGPGTWGPEKEEGVPLKVPEFEVITDEEGNAENVDTPEEHVFADKMQKERKRLLETDPAAGGIGDPDSKLVKRLRKTIGEDVDGGSGMSDADSNTGGRATSPVVKLESAGGLPPHGNVNAHVHAPMASMLGGQAESLDDDWEAVDPHPGRGRYKRVKSNKTNRRGGEVEGSSFRSGGVGQGRSLLKGARAQRDTPDTMNGFETPERHVVAPRRDQGFDPMSMNTNVALDGSASAEKPGAGGMGNRRPRPLTQHQRALEEHKRERIEWVLRRRKREMFRTFQARREKGRWLVMAARRIASLKSSYNSEDDDNDENNDGVTADAVEKKPYGISGLFTKNPFSTQHNNNNRNDEAKAEGEAQGEDDFGEHADTWAKMFQKANRRFDRWSGDADVRLWKDARSSAKNMNGTTNRNGEDLKRRLDEEIVEDILAERSESHHYESEQDGGIDDRGDEDGDVLMR